MPFMLEPALPLFMPGLGVVGMIIIGASYAMGHQMSEIIDGTLGKSLTCAGKKGWRRALW